VDVAAAAAIVGGRGEEGFWVARCGRGKGTGSIGGSGERRCQNPGVGAPSDEPMPFGLVARSGCGGSGRDELTGKLQPT